MSNLYTKKLIISSIALSLALGSDSLYAVKHSAWAAETTGVTTQISSGKGFPLLEEAATILGIDQKALEKSLQGGKSIVDVAKEKGISEADLTSKLLELRKAKIEDAVKSGKLDAAKADSMKQHMEAHLKFILNEKGLPTRNDRHFRGSPTGFHPDFEKLAESLGMTKEALKTELKSGKSLTEIAESKGISKGKLMDTIKNQLTPSIEQMIDRKNRQ